MARTENQSSGSSKKMEYRKVSFDVNEIAPDAPAGEWQVSIPRGKCKVQPTKEERFPMIVVPIRLDKTEEDDEAAQRALGTELTSFLVFGGKTPRGERMAKLRIRQICEAADVDLDVIPKEIDDPESDLEPLIRALEGKKFTAWTKLQTRKDTGEVTTELLFVNPNKALTASDDDDSDDADDDADEPAAPVRGASRSSNGSGKNGKGAAKKNKRS